MGYVVTATQPVRFPVSNAFLEFGPAYWSRPTSLWGHPSQTSASVGEDTGRCLLSRYWASLYKPLHSGHDDERVTLTELKSITSPSNMSSLPLRVVPTPVRYFRASMAWTHPMMPGVAPRTGKISLGGGSGKRHFRHGVTGGYTNVTCPIIPHMAP